MLDARIGTNAETEEYRRREIQQTRSFTQVTGRIERWCRLAVPVPLRQDDKGQRP
jgi:hypothetical protein